ncbi:OLC1v1018741C1 [Oldenlandia corymbosa var. corymbosa]|uniref:OLC1v1018741C1 n=1 Tax=Oldenlandia corymbosa var. corymbosa TaxID=529605 RepID=A0AAV1ECE7_OLDCO|nr:OLC1v1018741C1 [Oldenlandia corymbosa var. corymbosa]
MEARVVVSTSVLTAKEKNDTLVDVHKNSNSVSDCFDVEAVPEKEADKDAVHCQSSNKFLALQEIDNNEAILLDENDDDAIIDEVQKEENNSGKIDGELQMEDNLNQSNQHKKLVVFELVLANSPQALHEDVIEENASESMRKEGDSDEGLVEVGKACTLKQVDAKKQLLRENMENFEKLLAQVAKDDEPEFISARKQRKKPSVNRNLRVRR